MTVYLKSLTLRGFKSFADKTVMQFDPGLTVVVGPNGSGKSNISDAILWVLGEQSAKMLRGQAMEDVIFSGSSARQAVSMAEVTLVLDNSDGKLPVDYDEVAVTRRMYRSGESEYLINGAACRLLDITEILHDSGLGREMHSIISQGNLDSILSSRPEQRRELIEEAAGISKHQRRKQRSERKLKSMDENLTRAKDISREIQRQLRPLERQVGKARQAREIQGRLHEVTVVLAVDELRKLQQRHGNLEARLRESEAAASLANLRLEERQKDLSRYQSLLEEKGIYVGDLGAQRTRLQDLLARMDADMRVLDQKGRNMESRIGDLRTTASSGERDCSQAREELERVTSELVGARGEWDELKRQVDELVPVAREAKGRRKDLGRRLATAQAEQRAAQRTADQETLAHAKLRDQVGNAEVEDGLFASRISQLDEQMETCETRLEERESHKRQVTSDLERLKSEADEARRAIDRLQGDLGEARREEREARDLVARQKASLSALESVDEQAEHSSPLIAALMGEQGVSDRVTARLADVIEAPKELEGLVERLLGSDLAALVVQTGEDAVELAGIASHMDKVSGHATLLRKDEPTADSLGEAPGIPLISKVTVRDGADALVGALLGPVRIVSSAEEAIAAHEVCRTCTYVTSDGVTVLPDGRMVVGDESGVEQGALERKRKMRTIRKGMGVLERDLEQATARVADRENELGAARDRNARAKGDVARLKGELSSVKAETERLVTQRDAAKSERERVLRQRAAAADKAESARSAIERHKAAADEAAARVSELGELVEQLTDERTEASRSEADAERKLSDARLRLATVQERKNHLITRQDELSKRLAKLERMTRSARRDVDELERKITRVSPLRERYEAIRERAKSWQSRLDDRASLAEADSDELKKTIGDARAAVDEARKELQSAQESVNEERVNKGKLEVQVETAVGALESLGCDLSEALTLPEPEDREALAAEAADLQKRLNAIGPVNEVAMDEFTRLKQRSDYIEEQVRDLESARKSLAKITTAIERKMRRQFLVVFDQVNANFSEVFSLLFPGGQAHLELTDPDHLAETGIEIVAQPRGKKIQKMMLMSGGEKSLTALALLFAVYRTRTVPFYVFDEVEAALDDANLGKLLRAIEELRATTQLIVISHQRRTMEQADVLYGVSMQADGVSHVVSQRLDQNGRVVDA